MTKVISLSEKAYGTLKKRKRPNESFSDVVMRLASRERKKSILEFAGTWKGSDIDEIFSKLMKDREHSASRSVEAMAKVLVKTRKVGGSIVVSIPKEATEQEGIREGELVELEVRKARGDWFGAMKGVGPFTREDELDSHD